MDGRVSCESRRKRGDGESKLSKVAMRCLSYAHVIYGPIKFLIAALPFAELAVEVS